MTLFFDEIDGKIVRVDYATKNFVLVDDTFKDALVGGFCESKLSSWRSPIGTNPPKFDVELGTLKFKWVAPYWVLQKD